MATRKIGDTTVHVQTPEGTVVYGPGDTVSAEHAKLISNPKVWAEEDDDPKPAAKK